MFKGSRGLFEMTEEYSAFPEEKEVLMQDGLAYRVVDRK